MKLAAINDSVAKTTYSNNQTKLSFKGAGAFDSLVNFWQFIDNGGRALQFTAEDMTGTNIPRTIKGLLAGKKYTGHVNIAAFLQEAIREFLTGPTMCITPWLIITFAKKSGKTANTHIENIKNLSYLLESTAVQEGQNLEDAFYKTVVKDMFDKSAGGEVKQEAVDKMAELFKKLSITAKDKKEHKNVISQIQTYFEQVVKSTKADYKDSSFLNAKYSINATKEGSTKLKNYCEYTSAFITDFCKKFKSDFSIENIDKFKSSCLGKRLVVIAGMISITGILMSQIPKLYTKASGKINPNAKAIYDEAKKTKDDVNAGGKR